MGEELGMQETDGRRRRSIRGVRIARGAPRRVLGRAAAGALALWAGLLGGMVFSADAEGDAPSEAPPGRIEFVGRNLVATANGTFHRWRVVESRIDLAALDESHAVVEVDLASVDTGNDRRDDHLRTEDFFEVGTYPTATVRVHSARPAAVVEGGRPLYTARFDLDLHGVRRTLEGEIELESSDPPVFAGRLTIDRTDFGIGPPPSRWNPFSIDSEIPIRFRLEP
jgi:polyisoprenoid-binding protein YceI